MLISFWFGKCQMQPEIYKNDKSNWFDTEARTTELGILLWLAEWLGVDRCSVNSVLLHVVVVMENG
jgi:hypothetical protein